MSTNQKENEIKLFNRIIAKTDGKLLSYAKSYLTMPRELDRILLQGYMVDNPHIPFKGIDNETRMNLRNNFRDYIKADESIIPSEETGLTCPADRQANKPKQANNLGVFSADSALKMFTLLVLHASHIPEVKAFFSSLGK